MNEAHDDEETGQLPAPQLPEPADDDAAGTSDEPIIYRSGESDEGPALGWEPGTNGDRPGADHGQDEIVAPTRRSELQDAYDCLGIRTPLEELEAFARGRLEALVRAGEPERAQLAREAQELGLEALRRVMSGAAGQKEGA